MKYVMTAALALSLMAGGAAFAQDRHDDRREGGRSAGEAPRGGPPGAAPHGPRPGGATGGPRPGGPGPVARSESRFDRGPGPGLRPGPGPSRPAAGAFSGRPGSFLSSRNWHPDRRFRGPSYRYPRGFGYQRWAFGAFLPLIFLAPDYTLSDYWNYGLPAPPPGFHWIRVGPDALLVRYGDGYVLDAAYGLFY